MINFFKNCAELFTMTFNAAVGQSFFRFLICFAIVLISFGLFFFLYRGARRM